MSIDRSEEKTAVASAQYPGSRPVAGHAWAAFLTSSISFGTVFQFRAESASQAAGYFTTGRVPEDPA